MKKLFLLKLINSFLKELKIFSYDFIERFQKNVVISYLLRNKI